MNRISTFLFLATAVFMCFDISRATTATGAPEDDIRRRLGRWYEENPYVSAMMHEWHDQKQRLVFVPTYPGCGPPASNKYLWDAFEISDTLAVRIEALEAKVGILRGRLDACSSCNMKEFEGDLSDSELLKAMESLEANGDLSSPPPHPTDAVQKQTKE